MILKAKHQFIKIRTRIEIVNYSFLNQKLKVNLIKIDFKDEASRKNYFVSDKKRFSFNPYI